ncbi:ABC transporter substrate-binding protein [Marinomonas agarivorans]|nr:ABC transporter substrate-binding protein [Marinomonas agarivorans]
MFTFFRIYLIAFIATISTFATANIGPKEQVEKIIEQLKVEIVANKDVFEKDKQALIAKADEIFSPVINVKEFSKRVMGKYYRRASTEQRQKFIQITKTTLLNSYATALLSFDENKIKILPLPKQKKKNQARVNMEFTTDAGTVVDIIFYMSLNKEQNWYLSNVIINGINFGLTFRKQFEVIIQRNGNDMDAAIDAWADSLAKQNNG